MRYSTLTLVFEALVKKVFYFLGSNGKLSGISTLYSVWCLFEPPNSPYLPNKNKKGITQLFSIPRLHLERSQ